MAFNPGKHHRRSIRLKGYDYSQPGAYFVTIVTKNRAYLFGEIVDDEMRLNRAGQIAQSEWRRLGQRFPSVQLDMFVVMPNHIHGILILRADVGATRQGQTEHPDSKEIMPTESSFDNDGSPQPGQTEHPDSKEIMPTESSFDNDGSLLPDFNGRAPKRPHGPASSSLGAIIGQFKSRVTKRLWTLPGLSGEPIWQRNYYERIIRNDMEWDIVRNYVLNNPMNWENDRELNENAR